MVTHQDGHRHVGFGRELEGVTLRPGFAFSGNPAAWQAALGFVVTSGALGVNTIATSDTGSVAEHSTLVIPQKFTGKWYVKINFILPAIGDNMMLGIASPTYPLTGRPSTDASAVAITLSVGVNITLVHGASVILTSPSTPPLQGDSNSYIELCVDETALLMWFRPTIAGVTSAWNTSGDPATGLSGYDYSTTTGDPPIGPVFWAAAGTGCIASVAAATSPVIGFLPYNNAS